MQLPFPQANLSTWAKDVYDYLSYKEREQFDPSPARLTHLLPETKARPSVDGILMYDPALSGVVMSKDKQWQPLLAQSVGTITWDQVTDKPTTFPPSSHTHLWDDITDKPTTFPPSSHTHLWADITDKPTTFPPSSHTHLWADITDKPTTFPPSSHTHLLAEITDFNAADYATAAQGLLAGTAVQPGDAISSLSETGTAKILTDVERTKLAGLSASVASHCRYTNSDTATDISTATFTRIPLAGTARETHSDFTMNVAGDQLTVNFTGVVQIFASVSQNSPTARAGVQIAIWSAGVRVSAIQQAYIRQLSGNIHDAAAVTSVFAVTSGDVIEIRGQECGAAAAVTQTNTWSSLCATRIS